jgi:hypothetical protein
VSSACDPAELAAGGSRDHVKADPELRRHGSELTERNPIGATVLQARHERGRYSGLPRQIGLTQATSEASRLESEAKAKIVH